MADGDVPPAEAGVPQPDEVGTAEAAALGEVEPLGRVDVGPSPIAGRGVFARVALDEGTAVRGPLNHSCDPNVWFAGDRLVTRRPVAAGEELTYDYATGSTELVLYCHCETYRCRQLVAGDDWRIPQLQQRYAGHWAPSLQRLIDAAG